MSGRRVATVAIAGIVALLYFGGPRTYVGPARTYRKRLPLWRWQTLGHCAGAIHSQFGRYARSPAELGQSAADLISADLAAGEKHGYKIQPYRHIHRLHDHGGAVDILRHTHVLLGPIAGRSRERRPRAGHGQQQGGSKVRLTPTRAALIRWISIVALAVIAIVVVIVWPAVAKLNMARDYAEETSALKAIQTLHHAQVQYNSRFGRYARSLTELGPAASKATGENHSYKFTMTGTPTGNTITAAPSAIRLTRLRTFHSDQSLMIRERSGPSPRRPLAASPPRPVLP